MDEGTARESSTPCYSDRLLVLLDGMCVMSWSEVGGTDAMG